jgi:membrane protease YdiL (CAAX protease family)
MAISKQEFGIARSLRWTDLSWGLIGMVVYVALAQLALNIIVALVPTFNVTEAQDVGFTVVFGWERMLAFTVLVIVAPVVEELLFRGFLYGHLRKLHAPVWLSVLFVSAVFGFVHGQWNLAVDVFILGVVAALLREKTGTIWPGVVIHMMKNAVAFYLVFVMMMGR